MGLTISPGETTTRLSSAGSVAARVARVEPAPQRGSKADRSSLGRYPGPYDLGYDGLQQALESLPAASSTVSAALLTALIHTMGGAATSVACGLYVNTSI